MKIQQENIPFRPITIKLEKHSEAKALFSLVDKLEEYRCHGKETLCFSADEIKLVVGLSNALTTCHVDIF